MKIQNSLEVLNILENQEKYLKNLEDDLKKELGYFFQGLQDKILESLDNPNTNLDELFIKYHEIYYELLLIFNVLAYENGSEYTKNIASIIEKENKSILKSMKDSVINFTNDLFGTDEGISNKLKTQTFQASASTMSRIDKDINRILQKGYDEGLGNRELAKLIEKRFSGIKTWEAERIATTEINSAQNLGAYEEYFEDEIEYHQWSACEDSRVRSSHAKLDGEIVKVGTPFSNGLLFPGDRGGDIKEWIVCRCTDLPWICPYDMMVPPGLTRFRESDLIPRWNPEDKPKIDTGNEKLEYKENENYDDDRKNVEERLGMTDELKEHSKLSTQDLTDAQIKQNLKNYKELGIDEDVAKKMEAKIQPISNKPNEESYSFDLRGEKLEHHFGGSGSVQPAKGPYAWHNHPISEDGAGAIPSNGRRTSGRGDMANFIESVENKAWFGDKGIQIDGVAHGNQRIFIRGDTNKYDSHLTALSAQNRNGLTELTDKWKDLVDDLNSSFRQVNAQRRANGLSPMSQDVFALEYENVMYKEFNRVAKDYGVEIVRWFI